MWIVPITSCCGSYDAQKKFLLKEKTDKMHIKEFTASQSSDGDKNIWIKLNIDQTGFYRVKYDDELAAGLVNAIKAKKLSLMDKIGKDKKNLCTFSVEKKLCTFSRLLFFRQGGTLFLQVLWKIHMPFLLLASKH